MKKTNKKPAAHSQADEKAVPLTFYDINYNYRFNLNDARHLVSTVGQSPFVCLEILKITDQNNNPWVIKKMPASELSSHDRKDASELITKERDFFYKYHHISKYPRLSILETITQTPCPGLTVPVDLHHFTFAMPFTGISLQDFLSVHNASLSRGQRILIALKICQELEKIHGMGFSHGDIKPHNITLQKDEKNNLIVRFIDFGDAAELLESDLPFGSPGYFPNEKEGYMRNQCDLFALCRVLALPSGMPLKEKVKEGEEGDCQEGQQFVFNAQFNPVKAYTDSATDSAFTESYNKTHGVNTSPLAVRNNLWRDDFFTVITRTLFLAAVALKQEDRKFTFASLPTKLNFIQSTVRSDQVRKAFTQDVLRVIEAHGVMSAFHSGKILEDASMCGVVSTFFQKNKFKSSNNTASETAHDEKVVRGARIIPGVSPVARMKIVLEAMSYLNTKKTPSLKKTQCVIDFLKIKSPTFEQARDFIKHVFQLESLHLPLFSTNPGSWKTKAEGVFKKDFSEQFGEDPPRTNRRQGR